MSRPSVAVAHASSVPERRPRPSRVHPDARVPLGGSLNPITGTTLAAPDPVLRKRRSLFLSAAEFGGECEYVSILHVTTFHPEVIIACEDVGRAKRGNVLILNGTTGTWDIYASVYTALRGMTYAKEYYRGKVGKAHVSIGCLVEAITIAWELDLADETSEAYRRYVELLDMVVATLSRHVDEKIVDAAERAEWAKVLEDVLGRKNPMSRAAILCAAIRRLNAWVELGSVLVEGIDMRRLAILVLVDQAWYVRSQVLKDLVEIQRWWHSERIERLNQVRGVKLANRLKAAVAKLEFILVAPFGTHSFPHLMRDLTDAAELLSGNGDGWGTKVQRAGECLDRARRSLELLDFHRQIEDAQLLIGVYVRHNVPWTLEVLAEVRGALHVLYDDLADASDAGFKHPILVDVRENVLSAQIALDAPPDQVDFGRVKEHLAAAAQCF